MSYDIYCYKSKIGRPDLTEAENAIEADDVEENNADQDIKMKLANALRDYNPNLEIFEFDFAAIAKSQGITVEEAKDEYDHIELNTPESDLATQITINSNAVSITVPFWYSGEKAAAVFDKIAGYTKIIRQIAGYFVYDPQTGEVFDPLEKNLSGLHIYLQTTEQVEKMINEPAGKSVPKPWWKFW